MQVRIVAFNNKPLFSIITPVYNTPIQWLERMYESLQDQVYQNWELCLVDDCSTNQKVKTLLELFVKNDPRVKIQLSKTNEGISKASNEALRMAKGDYIVLLDHDDELTPDALFWFANEVNMNPSVDFIYSDECKIDDTHAKKLFHFLFKPDWSPEMLMNAMYTGHLTAYRKSLVDMLGGFRSDYDYSQDYDLALRISEKTTNISHIERVLYLWRAIDGSAAKGGKDFGRISNLSALSDAARRRGINARVSANPHFNYLEVLRDKMERISIIIPTDSYINIKKCLNRIMTGTAYDDYEIVIVCNSSLAEEIRKKYFYVSNLVLSRYDKPFNFSAKCNQGARVSNGAILVFLNDDVIPQEKSWLSILTEYLYLPSVGGVSPKLVFNNDRIQYAGMIAGTPGFAGTAYNGRKKDETDEFLSMHLLVRNVSVLSGACLAIKKTVFESIGSFDSLNTPNGHSDIDLSFRLMDNGWRCVYTPHTILTHVGNHSWHPKKNEKDKSDIFLLKRWGKYLRRDPYFTESMKEVLYDDFTHEFGIFAESVDISKKYSGKDILFVSHDLSLSGAPLALFSAAELLADQGHFCVIIVPQDGPMRKEFENAGIAVIVDAMLFQNHWLTERFLKNFDLILVNTLVGYPVINQLAAYPVHIIWWLHESKEITKMLSNENKLVRSAFDRTNKIISVSEYANGFLHNYSEKSIVIWNGIKDCSFSPVASTVINDKIRFCLIGTIEPRKGQDILVDAISVLPQEIRKKAEFNIMGRVLPYYQTFHDLLIKKSSEIPEVIVLEASSHEDALRLIGSCDILICPSLDESASLVTVEALMHGKPVIISKNVGVSAKLEHGLSSLIFETGNSSELSEMIKQLIENPEQIQNMGKEARKAYEKNFTFEQFSNAFSELIEAYL